MSVKFTPLEEAFCVHMVENGGRKAAAAVAAGYSEASAGPIASKLLKKPHIIARINELTRQRFASLGPGLLVKLVTLAETAGSEKVRLEAIRDLLDRGGFKPVEVSKQLEDAPKNVEELQKRAQQLLDVLSKAKATQQANELAAAQADEDSEAVEGGPGSKATSAKPSEHSSKDEKKLH